MVISTRVAEQYQHKYNNSDGDDDDFIVISNHDINNTDEQLAYS